LALVSLAKSCLILYQRFLTSDSIGTIAVHALSFIGYPLYAQIDFE
jgi:hypothetical protein